MHTLDEKHAPHAVTPEISLSTFIVGLGPLLGMTPILG